MVPNKEIVKYTDYRKFLNDFYEYKKSKRPGYSYRLIADRAGLSSPSFLRMVMEGDKNISDESALKIAHALCLNKKATDYFLNIVHFTQAKLLSDKEKYLKKIDSYRKKNEPALVLPEEYDYLRDWFHPVVREMVELKSFTEDPKELKNRFLMSTSSLDLRDSLEFLEKSGFLQRDAEGKLVKKEKTLGTKEIPNDDEMILIAKRYHKQMLKLAIRSLFDMERDKRSVTNTTLSLSQKSYDIALKRIENLRYELLELAAADDTVDRVCQLNINLLTLAEDKCDE